MNWLKLIADLMPFLGPILTSLTHVLQAFEQAKSTGKLIADPSNPLHAALEELSQRVKG